MSAISSPASSVCKAGELCSMIFFQTVVWYSPASLASASRRLPDDRPLISRLCSLTEGCSIDCQHPPRLQPTAPVSLSQGWTAAPGTSRHTRGHRYMQTCRDVESVGLFWSKKCRQDKCPLPVALLASAASLVQHRHASGMVPRAHVLSTVSSIGYAGVFLPFFSCSHGEKPSARLSSAPVAWCRAGVAPGVGAPSGYIRLSPHSTSIGVDTV